MSMRPELSRLHDLWLEIGVDSELPSRSDICPEALKPWLRNVALIDIERMPLRFRRRLVGTKIVDYQGSDETGHYLDDRDSDAVDSWIIDDYVACATQGTAVHRSERSTDTTGSEIRWERLLLPLASDGRTPDKILVALFCDVVRSRPSLPLGSNRSLDSMDRTAGNAASAA